MVAQQPAGDLVDQMDAGAGGAVHGFVSVGMICRRSIRQMNLNVHAGPRAAKDQFAHFAFFDAPQASCIDLAQGNGTIRKNGNRFSLATNAGRVCAEIMLKLS